MLISPESDPERSVPNTPNDDDLLTRILPFEPEAEEVVDQFDKHKDSTLPTFVLARLPQTTQVALLKIRDLIQKNREEVD